DGSMGEAYMTAGQKDVAIKKYEKSLQLDPKNQNAVEQLKKLHGERATMDPKVLHQAAFTVVGIAVRTSNSKETTAEGQIGRCWMRLFQQNVLAKIPNKSDPSIVALYTD